MGPAESEETKRPYVDVQRSRLVLAACNGLIDRQIPGIGSQIAIDIRPQGTPKWQLKLFASDSPTGIEAVARREADLAIVNPSAVLTLAYRGNGPFAVPVPVRAITVMPQLDCVGLAVSEGTGLRCLEDVAEERFPLKLSLRGERSDHSIHVVVSDILKAAGCPVYAIEGWGGEVSYDPGIGPKAPRAGVRSRLDLVNDGIRDALFDEGFPAWGSEALARGMRFLSLRQETLDKLTSMGYRHAKVSRGDMSGLSEDIDTIDFSGWPLFCHADTPDMVVSAFCEGLERHRDSVPWEGGDGPFPLTRFCRSPREAPLDVPLHRAAEAFWRQRGYLE